MATFLGWGNGHDGSATGKTGTVNTYAAMTASAGDPTVTTDLSVSVGDYVFLHQTRIATGGGACEIVRVASIGSGTFEATGNLTNTYAALSQAVLIPQYSSGDISGAITGTDWNGTTGGIISLICNGILTVSGSVTINGGNGSSTGLVSNDTTANGGTGGGFYGGYGYVRAPENDYKRTQAGEGYTAAAQVIATANGSGGEGGYVQGSHGNGAGGGHATSGGAGSGAETISGGGTSGTADLTTMTFGGGGGGGVRSTGTTGIAGSGGSGGGIILIYAKQLIVTGSISANGGAGANTSDADGGNGAGGSILIKTQIATLGTNLVTAIGGTTGSGGAGGDGRIRIDYLTSYTGTTNPTISAAQNTGLTVPSGATFLYNLI